MSAKKKLSVEVGEFKGHQMFELYEDIDGEKSKYPAIKLGRRKIQLILDNKKLFEKALKDNPKKTKEEKEADKPRVMTSEKTSDSKELTDAMQVLNGELES